MKLLHFADVHAREKDIEEITTCLNFIVETARAEAVDLTVIAGDLFDSRDIKLESLSAKLVVKTVSDLSDICPVAIITGTPSHEGTAAQILSYVRGGYPVHVATQPEQIELAGAVLTLIPTPTKQFFQTQSGIETADKEIGAAMSLLFAGFGAQAEGRGPHILVYHGGISGAKLSAGQVLTGQDIEVSTDQLDLARGDLNLCGHIHAAQKLGDHTFYSGSIYRNNWGELEAKGFYVHTLHPGGKIFGPEIPTEIEPPYWDSRFIETPCKKMIRREHDFTEEGQPENFIDEWEDNNIDEIAGGFVRCDFKVWQDEAGKLDKEAIREHYIGLGALDVDIRIIRVPRETVRASEVLRVDRLRDKVTAMAALKGEGVPGSVLDKADLLEEMQAEELVREVAA